MNSWQNGHIKTGFYDPSCDETERRQKEGDRGPGGVEREGKGEG
jgi:hypothetical protein